jgi:hypothetical protein
VNLMNPGSVIVTNPQNQVHVNRAIFNQLAVREPNLPRLQEIAAHRFTPASTLEKARAQAANITMAQVEFVRTLREISDPLSFVLRLPELEFLAKRYLDMFGLPLYSEAGSSSSTQPHIQRTQAAGV